MIHSLLVSGFLDDARLTRLLGEIVEIVAFVGAGEELTIVFDSAGGSTSATVAFLEILMENDSTRTLLQQSRVKIYRADSGAAFLAFSVGSWREVAADADICFHLPLVRLRYWQIHRDRRICLPEVVGVCTKYHALLARLFAEQALEPDDLISKLDSTGYLHLSAEECLQRRLVNAIF